MLWIVMLLASIGVAGTLTTLGVRVWRESRLQAEWSCVLSIQQELDPETDAAVPSWVRATEWGRLSDVESDQLLAPMLSRRTFDCAQRAGRAPLLDTWGHRLEIRVRTLDQGKRQMRIWSIGPDGVAGTKDDIGGTPNVNRMP